ncbi:MAG: hypothetical protein MJZ54_05620 [Bacteroidaceae bacterium]|nr:hypothetical protein [Bacteroidaceae bacterium]
MKKILFMALCLATLMSCGQKKKTLGQEIPALLDTAVNVVEEQEASIDTVANLSENQAVKRATINTNWVYKVAEDRLNSTKNYYAHILSTDGNLQFEAADIDLMGNGHYTTAFSIGWFDEALPECYDRIVIGIKFPCDSEWEKIYTMECHGRAAGLDIMIPTEMINNLTSYKHFSILLGNNEYEFNAKEPLSWSH